jgi:hypothetical protein
LPNSGVVRNKNLDQRENTVPRIIDLAHEANALAKANVKQETVRRQYVLRLGAEPALHMINDCLRQGKQPGPLLEEIISGYYTVWDEGCHVKFAHPIRNALDKAAAAMGVDREDVVREIVTKNIAALLSRLKEEQEALDKAIADPPKSKRKSSE